MSRIPLLTVSLTPSARRRSLLAAALLLAVWGAIAPAAGADDEDTIPSPAATTSVMVEVDDLGLDDDATMVARLLDRVLGEALEPTASSGHLDVLTAEVTAEGLDVLDGLGLVRRVEPLPELDLSLDDSVPEIGASDLHLDGRTGEGRAVAVIDTGVDASLPGVDIVAEACFLPELGGCQAETGPGAAAPCTGSVELCSHGSHIASIITADGGEFTGAAPDAGIIAIRVIGDDGEQVDEAGVLVALDHVLELAAVHDIAAVNLSLGGSLVPCVSSIWDGIVADFTDAGIALVAASGNLAEFEQWEAVPVDFPACIPGIVSVGSTTGTGEVSDITQSVPELDLLAPGECIESDAVFDPLDPCPPFTSGTSFAVPHVAAAFALVDGVQAGFDPTRAAALLRTTGRWIARPTPSTTDRDPRYAEVHLVDFVDFVPFADATSDAFWAIPSDWSRHTGVSAGLDGGVFGASSTLDRAQAVTLLWRFMGSPSGYPPAGFTDVVPGSFYARAVDWARATGVTGGTTATTFSPGDAVTRAQVAAFLWRLVGSPAVVPDSGFGDVLGWEYYADAVDWMDLHGITTGTSPSYFSPTWTIDRGQIITFLYRLARTADAWSGGVVPPDVVQF